MRRFPAPIHNAMAALGRLPGVGPKTALRYVFALLRLSRYELESVGKAIIELANVKACTICFTYAERDVCDICSDPQRDVTSLCIVSESRDIATMEATGAYRGKYFVLGGTLNPIDGRTPETLNVRQLVERLKKEPGIAECILAFSPDVHGETTILYLSRVVKQLGRKPTRLARGLPIGADIEYADEVTLASALQGRSAA
ncbi:MAG: Recombination protein RecR [Candidatus Uhrbacteria bacterium GW2011_GWD2_52_7]|uniref:Recombination protein RecR n=1 Tax=Candidatus Uhrbacteria bacterium GW2011_GWD2_52_7 TaxID=1618989 RepID=A0A0G1XIW0_9BACT|nr:MAG: Recombination protein RecR [Candidatus Uhrbacteria bacterium GW2011_GWD2_52_7]